MDVFGKDCESNTGDTYSELAHSNLHFDHRLLFSGVGSSKAILVRLKLDISAFLVDSCRSESAMRLLVRRRLFSNVCRDSIDDVGAPTRDSFLPLRYPHGDILRLEKSNI